MDYLSGYYNDSDSEDEVFGEYYDEDEDDLDKYFDASQNYGEPTDVKCITCCPVQPKR